MLFRFLFINWLWLGELVLGELVKPFRLLDYELMSQP